MLAVTRRKKHYKLRRLRVFVERPSDTAKGVPMTIPELLQWREVTSSIFWPLPRIT